MKRSLDDVEGSTGDSGPAKHQMGLDLEFSSDDEMFEEGQGDEGVSPRLGGDCGGTRKGVLAHNRESSRRLSEQSGNKSVLVVDSDSEESVIAIESSGDESDSRPGVERAPTFASTSSIATSNRNSEDLNTESVLKVLQTLERPKKVFLLCDLPRKLNAALLEHQHEGLSWMYLNETRYQCGMLCDDQGLGKTVSMISLILKNPPKTWEKSRLWRACDHSAFPQSRCPTPTLVVAPVVLLKQWKSEVEFFSNGALRVSVFHPEKGVGDFDPISMEFSDFDVILTTYGILRQQGAQVLPEESAVFKRDAALSQVANVFRNRESSMRDVYTGWPALFKQYWYRVVLDESHSIKNSQTATYKAACKLLSTHRWCLTGTPIHNRMDELYSQLSFLFQVREASSKSKWNEVISAPIQDGIKRRDLASRRNLAFSATYEEEKAWATLNRVVERYVLRRTKATKDSIEVKQLVPLPPKETVIRIVAMSPKDRKDYNTIFDCGKLAFLQMEKDNMEASSFLSGMFVWILRLRQFCDHPLLAMKTSLTLGMSHGVPKGLEDSAPDEVSNDQKKDEDEGPLGNRRQASWQPSSKMYALAEDLVHLRNEPQPMKALVFSQFTSFLDILEPFVSRIGFKFVRLDGRLSKAGGQDVIQTFRRDPDVELFLISLRAGGLGLNLVTASHVFIMDPWWNTALEDQAVDRVHRLGQLSPVEVIRYVTKDTMENKMLTMQEQKRKLTMGAFAEASPEHKTLGVKELRDLFGSDDGLASSQELSEEDVKSRFAANVRRIGNSVDERLKDSAKNRNDRESLFYQADLHSEESLWSRCKNRIDLMSEVQIRNILRRVAGRDAGNLPVSTIRRNTMRQLAVAKNFEDIYLKPMVAVDVATTCFESRRCPEFHVSRLASYLATRSSCLTCLELRRFGLRPEDILLIGDHCEYLKELRLIDCGQHVDTGATMELLRKLGLLEAVDFSGSYNLYSANHFLERRGLKEISLESCSEVRIQCSQFGSLNWEALATLEILNLNYCPKVVRLRHSAALLLNREEEAYSGVDELCSVLREVPRLRRLSFAGQNKSLTVDIMGAISSDLRDLQCLDLREAPNTLINPCFMRSLVRTCTSLRELNLSDSDIPESLASGSQPDNDKWKFMALTVSSDASKTEKAHRDFLEAIEKSTESTGKENQQGKSSFTLFSRDDESDLPSEVDTEAQQTLDRCVKAAKESLSLISRLELLEELYLSRLTVVDDRVVKLVSDGCKKLVVLDISGCHKVGRGGFRSLNKLVLLESLRVSGCSQLTPDDLSSWMLQLGQLHELFCWGCYRVLERDIVDIRRKTGRQGLRVWI